MIVTSWGWFSRWPAAVTRMEKYAGLVDGYEPITEQAIARTVERFGVEGLIGPYKGQVEQDLQRAETFVTGINDLLQGTDLQGWEGTYETLAGQLRDYNDWVRAEILPRARDDFRLPAVMYENSLRNWGVNASPDELIEQARAAGGDNDLGGVAEPRDEDRDRGHSAGSRLSRLDLFQPFVHE